MKCSHCGKPIDPNSRFCTWCDHDNYAYMNQVRTKDRHGHVQNYTSPTAKTQPPCKECAPGKSGPVRSYKTEKGGQANMPQVNGAGCMAIIIIVLVAFFILSTAIRVFSDL